MDEFWEIRISRKFSSRANEVTGRRKR